MWNILVMGGLYFMLPLTALAVAVLLLTARKAVDLFINDDKSPEALKRGLGTIVHLGVFSLVFGVFGQVIGLYQMFQAVEQIGSVSPALLAGGLKVSTLSTIYGFGIFVCSALFWFVLNWRFKTLATPASA